MGGSANTAPMPDPVAIITRPSRGCRQYVFNSLDELKAWASRKPYRNETVLVMPMFKRQWLTKAIVPASEAHDHVAKQLTAAVERDAANES